VSFVPNSVIIADGFAPNCTFNFTPVVPVNPVGPSGNNTPIVPGEICGCNLSGTGNGLPPLGEAVYNGFSEAASVNEGEAEVSVPDVRRNKVSAEEVCTCNTATFSRARSTVKINLYQLGGRVDIAETIYEVASANNTLSSAG
jgi:hypothetical protein